MLHLSDTIVLDVDLTKPNGDILITLPELVTVLKFNLNFCQVNSYNDSFSVS